MVVAPCAVTPMHKSDPVDLEKFLSTSLPELGHRNWIVVADAAYPRQVSPGIETVVVPQGQIATVKKVVSAMSKAKHVRPIVHLDRELTFVAEEHCSGIESFRKDLSKALKGQTVETEPHEEIIRKLDEAGQTFKILLIKTPHAMPYTSVFFQLDCGYWSPEAEKALRESIKASGA